MSVRPGLIWQWRPTVFFFALAFSALLTSSSVSATKVPSTGLVLMDPSCTPAWNLVSSPNFTSNNNFLNGIDALATDDVWAVGSFDGGASYHKTLVQHWNGSSWSVVYSPDPPNPSMSHSLLDVAALTANDIWAVGQSAASGGASVTLIEHWNGSAWSVVPSPNMGAYSNTLWDVAAISANDVWAVGTYQSAAGAPSRTLTLHWDGSGWSIVSSPLG
ncbi:MAG TPA: hypothetical protein VND68_06360, partial [Chloroflexia bacterium]|nr:hypothetical protein [Chloroflexia bacterium]